MSLWGIRFCGDPFAYPEVTQKATGAGDANSGLRERGPNGCSQLFGGLLIERFRFVGLGEGFSRGEYEKSKEEKARQKLPRTKRLHWRAPQKKRIGFSARLWPRPPRLRSFDHLPARGTTSKRRKFTDSSGEPLTQQQFLQFPDTDHFFQGLLLPWLMSP